MSAKEKRKNRLEVCKSNQDGTKPFSPKKRNFVRFCVSQEGVGKRLGPGSVVAMAWMGFHFYSEFAPKHSQRKSQTYRLKTTMKKNMLPELTHLQMPFVGSIDQTIPHQGMEECCIDTDVRSLICVAFMHDAQNRLRRKKHDI